MLKQRQTSWRHFSFISNSAQYESTYVTMECFRVEHTKLNNQKYTNVFHKNIRHGWLAASIMVATIILLTVNISKIPKTQKLNTTLEMTSLWQILYYKQLLYIGKNGRPVWLSMWCLPGNFKRTMTINTSQSDRYFKKLKRDYCRIYTCTW